MSSSWPCPHGRTAQWGRETTKPHSDVALTRDPVGGGEQEKEASRRRWLSSCCLFGPLFLCSLSPPVPLKQRAPHLHSLFPQWGTRRSLHLGFQTVSSLPLPHSLPAGEGNSALSPLNPGELLIALHNIDSAKCDMKSIIKGEAPPAPLTWPGLHGPRKNLSSPCLPGIHRVGRYATYSSSSELQHLPCFPPPPPPLLPSLLLLRKLHVPRAGTDLSSRKLGSPSLSSPGPRSEAEPSVWVGRGHRGPGWTRRRCRVQLGQETVGWGW